MDDLFLWADEAARYPHQPAVGKRATSKAAAEDIAPRVPTLRARCLDALRRQPMTADETAAVLGVSVLACRPRLTELANLGLIEDTGVRRENASGRAAAVWRVRA